MDRCEVLLRILSVARYFQSINASFIVLYQPRRLRFIYWLIGSPSKPVCEVLIFWLWELVMYVCLWHVALFSVVIWLSYWSAISKWLREMR
jgi:hypothetical protein